MEKTAEQVNELETIGAFYTEQEMKDELGYKQQPLYAHDILSCSYFQKNAMGTHGKLFSKHVDAFSKPTAELRSRIDKTVARGQTDPTYMMQFGRMFALCPTSLSSDVFWDPFVSKSSLMG